MGKWMNNTRSKAIEIDNDLIYAQHTHDDEEYSSSSLFLKCRILKKIITAMLLEVESKCS